jgi:hypothetical protein
MPVQKIEPSQEIKGLNQDQQDLNSTTQTPISLQETLDTVESASLDLERALSVPNALNLLFQEISQVENRYKIFDAIKGLKQLANDKAAFYDNKSTAALFDVFSSICGGLKELLKDDPQHALLAMGFEAGSKIVSNYSNISGDKGLDSYSTQMQVHQQLMQTQNEMDQDMHNRLTALTDRLHKSITDMFQAFEASARGR